MKEPSCLRAITQVPVVRTLIFFIRYVPPSRKLPFLSHRGERRWSQGNVQGVRKEAGRYYVHALYQRPFWPGDHLFFTRDAFLIPQLLLSSSHLRPINTFSPRALPGARIQRDSVFSGASAPWVGRIRVTLLFNVATLQLCSASG